MKKNTFFGITQGLMWLFLCTKMGYDLSNWQFLDNINNRNSYMGNNL